jgi:predicted ribosome-associated RNA-binding protein Tma20
MNTSTVTHTQEFTEGDSIFDIIAIDETHYLLAALEGVLKTTKDQLINHYHKGKWVRSLCHVTDSLY